MDQLHACHASAHATDAVPQNVLLALIIINTVSNKYYLNSIVEPPKYIKDSQDLKVSQDDNSQYQSEDEVENEEASYRYYNDIE